jgi:hypothetical protein
MQHEARTTTNVCTANRAPCGTRTSRRPRERESAARAIAVDDDKHDGPRRHSGRHSREVPRHLCGGVVVGCSRVQQSQGRQRRRRAGVVHRDVRALQRAIDGTGRERDDTGAARSVLEPEARSARHTTTALPQ